MKNFAFLALLVFGLVQCEVENDLSKVDFVDNAQDGEKNQTTTTEPTTEPDTTVPTTTPETTTTSPTTKAPPTSPPAPVSYFYNVTDREKNLTCIMIDGDFHFKIQYPTGPNMTSVANIVVPKPSNAVNASGTCHGPHKVQSIRIGWGYLYNAYSMAMTFNQSADGQHWFITDMKSMFILDDRNFPNSTDSGKALISDIELDMHPIQVAVNHSLRCYTSMAASNVTSTLDSAPYPYSVQMEMNGVQIQAFNMIPNTHDFVDAIHCDADKVSDIVPIAVGIALGVLVLIVIIAYIIGRRRRSGAYQSV